MNISDTINEIKSSLRTYNREHHESIFIGLNRLSFQPPKKLKINWGALILTLKSPNFVPRN